MNGGSGTTGGRNRIKSVETAFEIVESLQELDGSGVSELAAYLDIPKSTAHVYLNTLEEIGYVIKEDGEYRLGLRFLERGGYIRQRVSIYGAARPRIDELSQETGEVANFGIEEGGKRVLLYTSESPSGVFDNSPAGQYTHMHWTALGKSLLAYFPEERIHEIVDEHGLPGATSNTITERDELLEELATIREQGFAVEDEERREGIKAIGVPVLDGDEAPIGAVSISGPKSRIDEAATDAELVDTIKKKVNVIELKYQHY